MKTKTAQTTTAAKIARAAIGIVTRASSTGESDRGGGCMRIFRCMWISMT